MKKLLILIIVLSIFIITACSPKVTTMPLVPMQCVPPEKLQTIKMDPKKEQTPQEVNKFLLEQYLKSIAQLKETEFYAECLLKVIDKIRTSPN